MEKKSNGINKQLRKAIYIAEDLQNKADNALQKLGRYVRFVGFELNDEPQFSICSGNEIILEWHGAEIDKNHIISIMENVGFISQTDFFVA